MVPCPALGPATACAQDGRLISCLWRQMAFRSLTDNRITMAAANLVGTTFRDDTPQSFSVFLRLDDRHGGFVVVLVTRLRQERVKLRPPQGNRRRRGSTEVSLRQSCLLVGDARVRAAASRYKFVFLGHRRAPEEFSQRFSLVLLAPQEC